MGKGYKIIFWGLFFCTFHINLGPLPILPPFLGWIIIASGVDILYHDKVDLNIKKASYFAYANAGLTFLSFMMDFTGFNHDLLMYYVIVVELIKFMFVYYLLVGSITYLRDINRMEEVSRYSQILSSFMVIFILNTLLAGVGITINHGSLMGIVAITGVLLTIWLMFVVRGLWKMVEGYEQVS